MKLTEPGKKAFFDSIRPALFKKGMSDRQVDGMLAIISTASNAMSLPHLAYCLATTYHETARTMLPIKEMGGNSYFTKMYDIAGDRPAKARELGNTTKGDGARFCGRGYVQLTGKRNYEKAAKYLGRDLVGSPDLAMDMTIAAQVMFGGMAEGWFTGRRLGDYDSPNGGFDARNARRIINGTDKAATIAVYYSHFLTALRLMKAEMPVAPVVIPPPPDIPAIAPAVKPQSFWARLRAFFA